MPARDHPRAAIDGQGFRPLQAVLLALVLAFVLGEQRGRPVAIVVLLWSLGVLLGVPRIPEHDHRWSGARPVLETSLIVPLTLTVVAVATELPIGLCVVIALATWPVLWLLDRRRRRRTASRRDSSLT